ncbi:MAG TPA: hypothetical protein VLE44_01115 [Candidatus Saccharimonadales bacterium]|nr:hypothetical protein [Candidatus Saccharimonadales bacterium]
MADTKMLQAILDSQVAIKKELFDKINGLEAKVDIGFKKVNERLDSIGKSVAYLEDDTPTREEHNKLKKRVKGIENKLALS